MRVKDNNKNTVVCLVTFSLHLNLSCNKFGGLSGRELLQLCHRDTRPANLCLVCRIIVAVVGLTQTVSLEFLGTGLMVLVKVILCFHGDLCCSSCSSISVEYFVW